MGKSRILYELPFNLQRGLCTWIKQSQTDCHNNQGPWENSLIMKVFGTVSVLKTLLRGSHHCFMQIHFKQSVASIRLSLLLHDLCNSLLRLKKFLARLGYSNLLKIVSLLKYIKCLQEIHVFQFLKIPNFTLLPNSFPKTHGKEVSYF